MSKKNPKVDDFKLPEWLADDDYGSRDFEVFTHPRTKDYLEARDAHDRARAEFDELEAELLAPAEGVGGPDVSLDEVDPRQERLEELALEVAEAVDKVNELAAEVRETRHVIHVVDKLTLDEMHDLGNLKDGESFRRLFVETATVDDLTLTSDAWLALERKCGIGQWETLKSDVLEYLGMPGVTPDFSPLTSPSIRE